MRTSQGCPATLVDSTHPGPSVGRAALWGNEVCSHAYPSSVPVMPR